ncbi:MAG: translation initiation factor IF-2 subunit gamma [archaeon]
MRKKAEQPSVSVGLVGHVDHGKTTLVKAMSGKWTDTHSEEIKRGITIRLGYADATFYKCPKCKPPECYAITTKCGVCGSPTQPKRKVSFVDAPGHESLMATMLAGATIIDGALLLIAANEICPQPQTREHLMALDIIGIERIIVVQNKIDSVSAEATLKNYEEIRKFLKGTRYEKAPIVPISAQHSTNIDALIQVIEEYLPDVKRDAKAHPQLFVARSFDTNRPGAKPEDLVGGILGGTLKSGILKKGDDIEIRPGYSVEEQNKKVWKPLTTKIVGLMAASLPTDEIGPGGSVGIMTSLDPSIVKSDALAGSIAGLPGKLPPVLYDFKLEIHLLNRVVGSKEDLKVEPIKLLETLMMNVNSAATVGVVTQLAKDTVICKLKMPVCADPGSRVTISRLIGQRFRLIGYGIIK